MKTYIVCSDTNYDLMVHIVNANTEEEAYKLALEKGAWPGATITEVDTKTPGLVFSE